MIEVTLIKNQQNKIFIYKTMIILLMDQLKNQAEEVLIKLQYLNSPLNLYFFEITKFDADCSYKSIVFMFYLQFH